MTKISINPIIILGIFENHGGRMLRVPHICDGRIFSPRSNTGECCIADTTHKILPYYTENNEASQNKGVYNDPLSKNPPKNRNFFEKTLKISHPFGVNEYKSPSYPIIFCDMFNKIGIFLRKNGESYGYN